MQIKEEPVDEELDHNATLVSATEGVKTEAKVHKVGTEEKYNWIVSLFQPLLSCGKFITLKKSNATKQKKLKN